MSEFPTQFMSADPANSEPGLESELNSELMQARLRVQTIQRFQSLSKEILNIPDANERTAVYRRLAMLGKQEYGKAWDVLNNPEITVAPAVIGGRNGSELEADLQAGQISLPQPTRQVLRGSDFELNRIKVPTPSILVWVTMFDLTIHTDKATRAEVYSKAHQFGLELCPPDVGPWVRLQQSSKTTEAVIGMQPIDDGIFYVRSFDKEPTLFMVKASADELFSWDSTWVFSLPSNQQGTK